MFIIIIISAVVVIIMIPMHLVEKKSQTYLDQVIHLEF